ncbi:transcriptional regulator XRE family [Candidatus Termititenax persephonae]|uniref:Transcriptional regulator XRE family n=1 Tax=Candidatus Termititenax persephonae TaxID=2218525 RepID=A0A388TH56_9BACT|nr:transcriptional regulator XRE family [Candidatus Termititenax persephonae]
MQFAQLKQICVYNLKKFRKQAGMSQTQLGLRCATPASYICEIETGRKFPSLEMLVKIADALQVPPHLFLLDEKNKTPIQVFRPLLSDFAKRNLAERLNAQIGAALRRVLRKF